MWDFERKADAETAKLAISILLEPLRQMMTSPEVINCQTDPARQQNDNCNDNLSNQRNVLLQDVQYAPNRANQTNKPNKHNVLNHFRKSVVFYEIYSLQLLHLIV